MTPTSVQLYSVRSQLELDPLATVRRIAELGFEAVEPYGFADLEHWYTDALAQTGLAAPSGHASVVDVDDPDAVFAAATRLGITTVIDPMVRADWSDEAAVVAAAGRLNERARQAADHGLTVGYHNHDAELVDIGGRPALELLADHLDPEVVLQVDLFWAALAGVDVPGLLGRLGTRVRSLHVKDGILADGPDAQVALGDGDVDLRGALAAAPQAARVLEFDEYDGDVFEGLARGLRALPGLEPGA